MFVQNDTVTTSQKPANGQAKADKTPIAYINLYMPLASGDRAKLIPNLTLTLFAEHATDAALVEAIKSGRVTAEQVGQKIIAEIKLARDPNTPIEFDFGI